MVVKEFEKSSPRDAPPKPPKICSGEVLTRFGQQSDTIERGMDSAEKKKSHGMLPVCSAPSGRGVRVQDHNPEEQARR